MNMLAVPLTPATNLSSPIPSTFSSQEFTTNGNYQLQKNRTNPINVNINLNNQKKSKSPQEFAIRIDDSDELARQSKKNEFNPANNKPSIIRIASDVDQPMPVLAGSNKFN
jgi:hypothetical protein